MTFFSAVADLPANSTSYHDVGVSNTATYWYEVRAKKDGGFSDVSTVASATAGSCVPTSPTEVCGNGLVRADVELDPAVRPELRLGRGETGLDRAHVHEQPFPGVGERKRLRHARAVDELGSDDAFERGELLADGRLRVAEAACRAVERRLLGEREQRSQMAELDSVPSAPPNAFGHARLP